MESRRPSVGLSIKSNKRRYAIGESIFVDVTTENLSSQEIKILRYLLLPADDPRNNINFGLTDSNRQQVARISHTITGRALVQLWMMVETLQEKRAYTQTFQLAGIYERKLNRKTALKPLWSLGENPEESINEYPIQQKGKYQIVAIYQNTDDGSKWPEEYWDRGQTVWTGKLISNTISIEVFE
jgi:hypothetical protein